MNYKKFVGRFQLLFIAALFLVLAANAGAQDIVVDVPAPSPTETAQAEVPQAIPLAKITEAFAEVRAKKQELDSFLHDTTVEQQVNSGYAELKASLDAFVEEYNQLIEENTPADVWTMRSMSLDGFERQNTSLVEALQSRSKELAEAGTILEFVKEEWTLTAQEARQTKQHASVVADIQKVIGQIEAYHKEIKQCQGDLLRIQHLLDAQRERIDKIRGQLNEEVAQHKDRLLTRNSAMIWHSLTPKIMGETWNAWLLSLAKQMDDLGVFWAKNNLALSVYLLIFAVVVLAMRGIHHVIKPWGTRSETLRQVVSLTELPVPIAALLSTFCFMQGGGTALHITRVIAGLFAVIPALIVMRRIINDCYNPLLGAILVAYGIDLLHYLSYETVLVVRLCVLVEAILLVFLLIPCMRPAIYKKIPEEHRGKVFRRVKLGCKVVIALMGVAICSNVVGYVDLATCIVFAVVTTAVRAVMFVAAAHFILALVLFVITVPPLKYLHLVSSSREVILNKTKSFLYGLVVLLVIMTACDMFGCYALVVGVLKKIWSVHIACGNIDFLLGNLILALFILWIARPVSRFSVALLREDVLPRLHWQTNSSQMVIFFAYYIPYILGILMACAIIGLSLDNVAMVASALTLGVSFGLQDIFKNFVSGIILLFEPRIVVGGAVEFGNISGTLVQIGMRASVVRLFDGRDVIVPNSEFISNKVVSITDSQNVPYRFAIVFSVLGTADVEKVREVAEKCAVEAPDIVAQPAPVLLMSNIKDGYPEYTLQAWAKNYNVQVGAQNSLTYNLTKALRAQGWELAGVKHEVVGLDNTRPELNQREKVGADTPVEVDSVHVTNDGNMR